MSKALVVDDSPIVRRILIGVLAQHCDIPHCDQAGNGEEALEFIKQNTYQLILLDWNMPKMTGIQFLHAARAIGVKTPIVMVTSEADRARVLDAVNAGATNYIIKPFNVPDIAKKITRIISASSV